MGLRVLLNIAMTVLVTSTRENIIIVENFIYIGTRFKHLSNSLLAKSKNTQPRVAPILAQQTALNPL